MSARTGSTAQSRAGKKPVTGYFDVAVLRELKMLAADKNTTLQCLLAIAINDFLERHGKPRIADESQLPRGGAAQKIYRDSGS